MGAAERSLEPAPASGEVDLLGEEKNTSSSSSNSSNPNNRAHVEAGDSSLHPPTKEAPFGSLDFASAVAGTVKGPAVLVLHSQSAHPLDPLGPTEIAVAIATVTTAGGTPEVVLNEPDQNVVALAYAYFFPPYQRTLSWPKAKGVTVDPLQWPPRQALLVVYNKGMNETSIWFVELSEVHATARGDHHRGKLLSSVVVPDTQPPMDAIEFAEC